MTARLSIAFSLVVVLVAPVASAQPALTPKAAAQESYGKGVALANQADAKHDPTLFEAAYLQFAQAYAIYPDDKVLWNLAASELHTKRFVEALHHFRLYEAHRHIVAQTTHPEHARLVRLMGEASAATARVKVSAPAGTEVLVDGVAVGTAPLAESVDVLPGEHRVDARKDDLVLNGVATVAAAQEVAVELVAPIAPPLVPRRAAIAAPVVPPAAAPHQDTTLRDTLRWGTAGVAVVGIAVGVGFLVDEHSKSEDFNAFHAAHPTACAIAASAWCAQAHASYSDVTRSGTIGDVALVVGGVAAVSSAALWLFWPKPDSSVSGAAWVLPRVGAGSCGIDVGGRF